MKFQYQWFCSFFRIGFSKIIFALSGRIVIRYISDFIIQSVTVTIARACFVTFLNRLKRWNSTKSNLLSRSSSHSGTFRLTLLNAQSGKYHAAPRLCPSRNNSYFYKCAACSNIQLTVACPASWIAIAPGSNFVFSSLNHQRFYRQRQGLVCQRPFCRI
jgi:hypothetical protein